MKKHSVTIAGHRTSVTLEDPFWKRLKEMAFQQKCPLRTVIETVDAARDKNVTLSSALRLYVAGLLDPSLSSSGQARG